MIVKVQLSLMTSAKKRQALVYNKDRSVMWEGDAPLQVVAFCSGKNKAFFHAHLADNGMVMLDKPAKWQTW